MVNTIKISNERNTWENKKTKFRGKRRFRTTNWWFLRKKRI